MLDALAETVMVGLAVGYLVRTFVQNIDTIPGWLRRLYDAWREIAPDSWDGKPFRCSICMSFWGSVIMWFAVLSNDTQALHWPLPVIVILASSLISLVIVDALTRLNTVYLSR